VTRSILLASAASGSDESIVILPIGSLENHGVLPLGTDVLIATCVSEKAARLAACRGVVTAPPIPYSVAVEHAAPRITCSPETFIRYLEEVGASLLEWSRGAVFAVFHGGAFSAAYLAARVLRAKGHNIAVYSVWEAVSRILRDLYDVDAGLIHADPIEASMLLACGHSVGVQRASKEAVLESLPTLRQPRVTPWVHSDVPRLYPGSLVQASEELGEELVSAVAKELADYACSLAGGYA